jgi:hypothetical protein
MSGLGSLQKNVIPQKRTSFHPRESRVCRRSPLCHHAVKIESIILTPSHSIGSHASKPVTLAYETVAKNLKKKERK